MHATFKTLPERGEAASCWGGGFVGIQAALALKRLGLNVTNIEMLDRILFEKLDNRGSSIIADLLKCQEINNVATQAEYEIIRVSGARSIRFASGRIIDADLIVEASVRSQIQTL
jgi:nitrite reductase [NAD(P)H] large subunit